ncbi:MAG: YibE/F family protein [Clostridium sp.]|uniref:YibE/F-like protein n=1 Tax=Clostridium paraputrificum TaxID=29363 RepID=A0A6N3GEP7_9CLOT|nr:YibE/F family protein [Clostridium sp.]MBS5927839.1 YibE/F family protein [Clostridium sp.]MBS5985752.1 YibE/F family protein [Clostridium sp.]
MLKRLSRTDIVITWLIGVFILCTTLLNNTFKDDFKKYDNSTLSYEKARVISVIKENLEKEQISNRRYSGIQELEVELLTGELKGEKVEVTNYITQKHNVVAKEGKEIMVCVDRPSEDFYKVNIYNYSRNNYIYIIVIIFFVIMVLIGRGKGFRSMIGLLFTFYSIIFFMIPFIYRGYSPIALSIIVSIISTIVTLFLLNGWSKKTIVATLATCVGVIISGVIFYFISNFLNISGFNLDEAESLILIAQNTGLKIRDILFSGILISSLGAVMDVAMSIASSIYEINELNRELDMKTIFKSGINIGRDMIGTMSNTLILAFAGTSLSTMLALYSYNTQFNQLMSSDFIAIEFAQSISGSIGIILAVPITSFISAYVYKRKIR